MLTPEEVKQVLAALAGTPQLVARLLYGSGLRLLEGLRLGVQDLDFAMKQLTVRGAKGANYAKVVVMQRCSSKTLQRQGAVRGELSKADRPSANTSKARFMSRACRWSRQKSRFTPWRWRSRPGRWPEKPLGRRPKSNLCGLQQYVTWRSCCVFGKRWRCWWPAAPGPEPPSAK